MKKFYIEKDGIGEIEELEDKGGLTLGSSETDLSSGGRSSEELSEQERLAFAELNP